MIQQEHVDWIRFRPISPNETEIAVTTLIPKTADLDDTEQAAFWRKNHEITITTLDENWAIGASIQKSIDDQGLPHIQYGKNEWALQAFNEVIKEALLRSNN